MSHFLNQLPTFLHKVQLLHRSPFLFTVCFFACTCCCPWCLFASVIKRHHSATCTKATSEKIFQACLHSSAKSPASESVLTASSPVEGLPPLPSVPFSDLDVPIGPRKGKRSCTDHLILILFHMIILLSLFSSVSLVFILCIFTQVVWGGYIGTYLKAGYGWGDGCSYFLKNLGVSLCI